jgi:hypothetical protein
MGHMGPKIHVTEKSVGYMGPKIHNREVCGEYRSHDARRRSLWDIQVPRSAVIIYILDRRMILKWISEQHGVKIWNGQFLAQSRNQ